MASGKKQRSKHSTAKHAAAPRRCGDGPGKTAKAARPPQAAAAGAKARTRRAFTYFGELREGLKRVLPRVGLPLEVDDARVRWTPRWLVITAILMSFNTAHTLKERFQDAREALVRMYDPSHRKRPGRTPEGFIAALCGQSAQLLERICQTLRQMVQDLAGSRWKTEGWVLFGVDGTRVECPQTEANEQAFGCAGKKKTTPQQLLVMLLHLGTGLPWAFARGAGTVSERVLLRPMLGLLPAGSMLVADAGYTGYDLLRELMGGGHHLLIRVGRNVSLLRKLGYELKEHGDIVYLWPCRKQGRSKAKDKAPKDLGKVQPPLVLRLIRLHDGRQPVCLLTDILDRKQLSDRTAARLYQRRWLLELYYRGLKQTMEHRKLLSDGPTQAQVELDWCVAGLWLLGVMTVQALVARGLDPAQASVAGARDVVRTAMKRGSQRWRRGQLRRELARAVKDGYRRHGSKQARHPKSKKRERPPGEPKVRRATVVEKSLARRLATHERAAAKVAKPRDLPAVASDSDRRCFAA